MLLEIIIYKSQQCFQFGSFILKIYTPWYFFFIHLHVIIELFSSVLLLLFHSVCSIHDWFNWDKDYNWLTNEIRGWGQWCLEGVLALFSLWVLVWRISCSVEKSWMMHGPLTVFINCIRTYCTKRKVALQKRVSYCLSG